MKILIIKDDTGHEGSCNERCYDAYKAKCTRVCGGINHGVGLVKAREQAFELFESILEDLGPSYRVRIPDNVRQEELNI